MKCPHCQGENPQDSEFCGDCEKSLKLENIFPKCGHSCPPDKKFCKKCGQTFVLAPPGSSSPPASVQPQPSSFANRRYQVKKLLEK